MIPITASKLPSSVAINMLDCAGFVRPLVAGSPARDNDFAIGGGQIKPGRVPLDSKHGVRAPGYVPSRLAWVAASVVLTRLARMLYAPHSAPRRGRLAKYLERRLQRGPPPPAIALAPPAPFSRVASVTLLLAEFRLIGAGTLFPYLAVIAALLGLLPDFRHIGSPAGLLL